MLPRNHRLTSCLTALAGLLLAGGCGSAAAAPPPAGPGTSGPAIALTTPAAGPARSIDGLPGSLYYLQEGDDAPEKLVRLNLGGRLTTVLAGDGAFTAEVSPDGRKIAWVDDDFDLNVADADGRHAKRLLRDVAGGYGHDPVWSADGTRILTGVSDDGDPTDGDIRPVVVRVADRSVTDLPQPIRGNLRYRWSGDGREVFFTDGQCRILHARADGTAVRTVPVLGSPTGNPSQMRACDIVSVNPDGSRITVPLHVGDEPDGDVAGEQVADAVVDTATGAPVPLPVRGTVLGALYRADGTLLVRAEAGGARTLTLFSPAGAVLAEVAEPASLKAYSLYDHTR